MQKHLRILVVEDSPEDVGLFVRVLRSHGFQPDCERVETDAEFRDALASRNWDLVLSDFALPRFSAKQALASLQQSPHQIPFIVVTGAIDEETAVECLRSGADNHILKENLIRLGPAVEQALRMYDDRRRRRILENQLRQTHKLETIGALAGGIVHDFNNLLFGIRIFTELTLDGSAEDSFLHKNLKQVLGAVDRAKDLVDKILAFSRGAEKKCQVVSLGEVIHDAMKMLRPVIPADIAIRCRAGGGSDLVYADRTELHQVIVNLCVNAAQAMKARGGALHIGVEEHEVTAAFAALHPELKPGRHVHLRVADTGAGILPEDLPRIFEPFFTTRSDHEGSGLGLTIVHDIVKSSSGAIAVESDPGRGSTFHVYLPVVEGEAMNEEPLSGPPAEGRERILLIDDEEALIRMGRQMLQSLGYQVLPLSSGVEALERFRADPFSFDLVITDQTMPGITGDDLSRELLRIRPDIPIILCSGYTDRITEVEARRAGIRRFVRKPTPLREFARLIREALDAPWPLPGNGNTSSAASP